MNPYIINHKNIMIHDAFPNLHICLERYRDKSMTIADLDKFDITKYQLSLIGWGKEHFRTFPWRTNTTPYRVLIAELMLHRTQAIQVQSVYSSFMEKFPDVSALASATADQLKISIGSLGLTWRIALIMDMAKVLAEEHEGKIPEEKVQLMALPGIGHYIASSVRCFAFGIPDAIIDTNVVRVLTRLLGIPSKDSLRRNRQFQELAQAMVDSTNPRAYNYAVLDLASLVCRPRKPDCSVCPVNQLCHYQSAHTNI